MRPASTLRGFLRKPAVLFLCWALLLQALSGFFTPNPSAADPSVALGTLAGVLCLPGGGSADTGDKSPLPQHHGEDCILCGVVCRMASCCPVAADAAPLAILAGFPPLGGAYPSRATFERRADALYASDIGSRAPPALG
jgi:hypothetical protein